MQVKHDLLWLPVWGVLRCRPGRFRRPRRWWELLFLSGPSLVFLRGAVDKLRPDCGSIATGTPGREGRLPVTPSNSPSVVNIRTNARHSPRSCTLIQSMDMCGFSALILCRTRCIPKWHWWCMNVLFQSIYSKALIAFFPRTLLSYVERRR